MLHIVRIAGINNS